MGRVKRFTNVNFKLIKLRFLFLTFSLQIQKIEHIFTIFVGTKGSAGAIPVNSERISVLIIDQTEYADPTLNNILCT